MSRATATLASLFVLAALCTGCSTRAWYGGLQAMAVTDCNRRAPSERDACAAQANRMSYDQYEYARKQPPGAPSSP